MVMSVDKEVKKIALSMKAVGKADDIQALKTYKTEEFRAATLADKFKGLSFDDKKEDKKEE